MTLRELCKTVSISSDGVLDIICYKDNDDDYYYSFGFSDYCALNKVVNDPSEDDTRYLNGDEKFFDCEVRDIECTRYGIDPYLRIEVSVPDNWEHRS